MWSFNQWSKNAAWPASSTKPNEAPHAACECAPVAAWQPGLPQPQSWQNWQPQDLQSQRWQSPDAQPQSCQPQMYQPHRNSSSADGNGSAVCLLDRVFELQAELWRQRETRQERATSFQDCDNATRVLRDDLQVERCMLENVEADWAAATSWQKVVLKQLEELAESHYALLSRKATLEAEIRRFSVAAFADEAQKRKAQREREWARDGPEMEALRDAKVLLAESLGQLDEARMQSRHDLASLQQEVAAEQYERARLKNLHDNTVQAPSLSLRQSVWHRLRGN